jgi:SAM-dependent methyltransferase
MEGLTKRATGLYVQYGCGLCAPDPWLNFDASPRLRIERLPGIRQALKVTIGLLFPPNVKPGNIVTGLPIPEGSAAAVYCSHVLEHIPREDLPAALRNTFSMLAPGGIFRLVVPDLQWRAAEYSKASELGDSLAADKLMDAAILGRRIRPTGLIGIVQDYLGNHAHLWMYDFPALKALLEQAGFSRVRRCEFGDAPDPLFSLVEEHDRFFEGEQRELAIEAIR